MIRDTSKHDPKREHYPWSVQQLAWFPEYLTMVRTSGGAWVRKEDLMAAATFPAGPEVQVWMPCRHAPRIIPHTKRSRKQWTRTGLWDLTMAMKEAARDKAHGRVVRVRNWCTNQRIMLP